MQTSQSLEDSTLSASIVGRDAIKDAYRESERAKNYIAERFSDGFGYTVHREQVRRVNEAINRHRPQSLLEIACGPARVTTEIAPVARAVAIEQSPAMLAHAKDRLRALGCDHWTLVEGDAFDLPFDDASFDMIATFRFIRHFDPTDCDKLLGHARRVLREGGHLILDVANARAYRWILNKWGVAGSWVDDYWFTKAEFKGAMARCGFDVVKMHPVLSPIKLQYYLGYLGRRVSKRAAEAVGKISSRILPGEPYEWVAICRRA